MRAGACERAHACEGAAPAGAEGVGPGGNGAGESGGRMAAAADALRSVRVRTQPGAPGWLIVVAACDNVARLLLWGIAEVACRAAWGARFAHGVAATRGARCLTS